MPIIYDSLEKPEYVKVSFESDPNAQLGAQLLNLDKGDAGNTFSPGYASIASLLLKQDTIARKSGVLTGDFIVAVNGEGFRRMPPHHDEADATEEDIHNVVSGSPRASYNKLLDQIKKIKKAKDPANHLFLSLERYHWDAKPNSWFRFLDSSNKNEDVALQNLKKHENWKNSNFPIDFSGRASQGVFSILQSGALKEITFGENENKLKFPTVSVNYGKLKSLEGKFSPDDMVKSLFIVNDMLYSKQISRNPRKVKFNYFVNVTDFDIQTIAKKSDLLKLISDVLEQNYPGILNKIIIYPISEEECPLAHTALEFVNDSSQKKIAFAHDVKGICTQLRIDEKEFMHNFDFKSFLYFEKDIAKLNTLIFQIEEKYPLLNTGMNGDVEKMNTEVKEASPIEENKQGEGKKEEISDSDAPLEDDDKKTEKPTKGLFHSFSTRVMEGLKAFNVENEVKDQLADEEDKEVVEEQSAIDTPISDEEESSLKSVTKEESTITEEENDVPQLLIKETVEKELSAVNGVENNSTTAQLEEHVSEDDKIDCPEKKLQDVPAEESCEEIDEKVEDLILPGKPKREGIFSCCC